MKTDGFTEDQMMDKFSRNARYQGGGCYSISFFGRTLYDTCTLKLREKWQACFIKRNGRYFYNENLYL